MPSPKYALRIKDIEAPLLDIQHHVAAIVPTGLRTVSPNGREFYSQYFRLEKDSYVAASEEAPDRYFATVTVLGDRRPYDIEIFVTREKRVVRGHLNEYVVTGHDMRLAKELEIKLHNRLTKRREDRNIIDDFRVF